MHLYNGTNRNPGTGETLVSEAQSAISGLWPSGRLSLRKSPCIRKHCQLCESGQGHSSYALYGRKGKRRFSIYVPDELAEDVERAIRNGRDLQKLMTEAGRRYTLALKNDGAVAKPKVASGVSGVPAEVTRCSTRPTFSAGVRGSALTETGAGNGR